ncbi:MAG: cytochrome P450 [Acidobacteriota bacterium]
MTGPPPGPAGVGNRGSLREYSADTLGFLRRSSREYGDVVAYRLGHQRACLVTHPAAIERVLVTDAKIFPKSLDSDPAGVLQTLVGVGLLTADGPAWASRRRLARPYFAPDRMADYAALVDARARTFLEGWGEGEVRDIHREMTSLAVAIIGDVFLGAELEGLLDEVGRCVETAMEEHVARLRRPPWLPGRFPTPGKMRFRLAMKRFDRIVRGLIRARRAAGSSRDDLLGRWVGVAGGSDADAAENEVRDEVATIFLAGHDTTALTLTWAAHLLSTAPAVEERLAGELDAALGGRTPALSDLRGLRYLDAVLHETLRLYPSAWGFSRLATSDCEIGGYRIPAGTSVLVSPWVTQRDPRFFEDPESFRPERWMDGLSARIPRFAYFPFGGGPRLCIGAQFGMMEAALLLAVLVQRFRLHAIPGKAVEPWASITLRPRGGLEMVVRRRG